MLALSPIRRRAARSAALATLLAAASVAAGTPATAGAQDAGAPPQQPRTTLHGYFTQAAGVSRGGPLYGLPASGTLDLRRAALLTRFAPSRADRFVAQIAHQRVGDSPLAPFYDELEVDWLFYERVFGDATQLRVGRIPVPMGIYNETRYVGPLLPFYQAPVSVYRQKEFTNESIDGVALSHELFAETAFPLEVAVYGGGIDYVESLQLPVFPTAENPAGGGWVYYTTRARARRMAGAFAWLGTPVPGLRLGAGALRTTLTGGMRSPETRHHVTAWSASVDGSFERSTVRAEVLGVDLALGRLRSGYLQLGHRLRDDLTINLQTEYGRASFRDVTFPPSWVPRDVTLAPSRDHAAGVVWAFGRRFQLKVEGHVARGFSPDQAVDPLGPAPRGRYAVTSLSAAF